MNVSFPPVNQFVNQVTRTVMNTAFTRMLKMPLSRLSTIVIATIIGLPPNGLFLKEKVEDEYALRARDFL